MAYIAFTPISTVGTESGEQTVVSLLDIVWNALQCIIESFVLVYYSFMPRKYAHSCLRLVFGEELQRFDVDPLIELSCVMTKDIEVKNDKT